MSEDDRKRTDDGEPDDGTRDDAKGEDRERPTDRQDGDKTAMQAPRPHDPGLKIRLEEKLGLLDDMRLVGYHGYGTATALHVEGRLIEKKGEAGEPGDTGLWDNMRTTLRRFESDEIPGARIRARFRGGEWDTWTDNEGFFKIDIPLDQPLEGGWHDVDLEVIESLKPDDHPTGTAPVLVPSADVEFAVVSDLDDTVIRSSASKTLRKIKVVFENDARSRAAFAGVGAFYHALVEGADARGINPIFYVSRSGWNMFDLFDSFLEDKEIPAGPIFLRDLSIKEDKSSALGHERHKRDRIRLLMEAYPELSFVLIGDSGQDDPETYRQLVHHKPGRVRAIYIRDVSESESRDREVREIAEELEQRGVPTCLVADTVEAGEHAVRQGLITEAALERIREAAGESPASQKQV